MTAKTPAQRQADLKARRKVAGVVKVTVWADREDVPSIREHAEQLARWRDLKIKTQARVANLVFTGKMKPRKFPIE